MKTLPNEWCFFLNNKLVIWFLSLNPQLFYLIACGHASRLFNTLRPRQDGRHFVDDTFKHIFLNENVRISIKISLKLVAKGPINNIPALVQIMAWCRPGDKPLSEPMLVFVPTHICVTWPQWVNLYLTLLFNTMFSKSKPIRPLSLGVVTLTKGMIYIWNRSRHPCYKLLIKH